METFAKEFEKPLNLRGIEVRAILDGHKTQTRKVLNPRLDWKSCPFGKPGFKLWVREKWAATQFGPGFKYTADLNGDYARWKANSTMPRQASRITLEITGIRLERLHSITRADCLAEGILDDGSRDLRGQFEAAWASNNFSKNYIWRENPLVWVIEHRVYEVGTEAILGYVRVTNFMKAG